jgi:hypothetical protein
MIESWRWAWRIWRARHYVWAADLAYRRYPCRRNADAYETAAHYLHRLEVARP